jgi:hypothetical protein
LAKRLGQNLVTDAGTVRRIAGLAGLDASDVVLEVGPGFGSLTLPLPEAAASMVAVEADEALAAQLPCTVAARAPGLAARLHLVTADAARVCNLRAGRRCSLRTASRPAAGTAARQRAAQKELGRLERHLDRMCGQEAELTAELAEHASDYAKLIELGARLRAVQDEKASLEDRRLTLAEELSG